MVIHYRKNFAGTQTWCGEYRDVYRVMSGGRDNTSPFRGEVTCKKCLANADKWLEKFNNERAKEERLAKGADGMYWVYVAGPYTNPDPVENTNKAIKVANRLVACGFTPIIPHLTLAWNLVSPYPAKFWYDYTLQLMFRCDAVYRMKGASVGGDVEVEEARKAGMPVFLEEDGVTPENLDGWFKKFADTKGMYQWRNVLK
jgi:hypothetical protein